MRMPTDDEVYEIAQDIVADLDPEDLLAMPGVYEFVTKHYADDILMRHESNLVHAQEQAAAFQRDAA